MKQILTKGIIFLSCILIYGSGIAQSGEQNAFYILLNSPKDQGMDALSLLSQRSLDRRLKELDGKSEIVLTYDDYPVNTSVLNSLLNDSNIQVRYTLKWHNAVVVNSELRDLNYLKDNIPGIKTIAYVGRTKAVGGYTQGVKAIRANVKNPAIETGNLTSGNYGIAAPQVRQIKVDQLHKSGFDGKGVHVAIFDAGFKNADKITAFANLAGNRQLWVGGDIVDLDQEVTDSDNHGTAVMSCIAGYDNGKYIGTAPNSTFYLFRTENGISEYPLEELNWCKAAEIADSIGVDVITSSLGYNEYDDESLSYTHYNLDGRTSFISKSAKIAFEHGIVVVNSAGNEGDGSWRKIGTPADVPEVLTVGAVDANKKPAGFTSQGYNANGIVKPDVAGIGFKTAVASPSGSYYKGYGTSYSTPVVAGGVACLRQAFPNAKASEIVKAIRSTAENAHEPDSFAGYGVANYSMAMAYLKQLEHGFPEGPILLDTVNLLFYNPELTPFDYTIYKHKRILWLFKRIKPIHKGSRNSTHLVVNLNNDEIDINCSKKYTIKIKFKAAVDKEALKYSDLSLCSS